MGEISKIYGCIIGPTYYRKDWWMNGQNHAILARLPEMDNWPPLTHDMFVIPSNLSLYVAQVISFGASYNRVESVWDRWLAKFEALLYSLYCEEAHVHLITRTRGAFHYQWEPVATEENRLNWDPPVPLTEWRFSGGPRSFLDTM